ncbi:hypothetical protein [Nocardia sp. alder85J]|uniref:hypothetical protein n=1 Tax=Nocardia sp. alder85J TaxID=2862949 RepID=UPI001CD3F855|nr:hypothetical protein [Nocardia sp. alder85J]MCX4099257.1 hypothetical protein [Nocardia sp. alder85J]
MTAGPIQISDARDGWSFAPYGPTGPQLVRDYDDGLTGYIRATTPVTVAWTIINADRILRQASAVDVATARAAADTWVARRGEAQ